MLAVLRFVLVFGVLVVSACGVADLPGTGERSPTPAALTLGDKAGCEAEPAFEPRAPDTLPRCACAAGGSARCVAASTMPSNLAHQLEKCDGDEGACVPDTLLTRGNVPPPSCASAGKEGRCLGLCVPLVSKYAQSLGRGDGDACPADERCVPCDNPLDGTPTGVCDLGKPKTRSASCDTDAAPAAGIDAPKGEALTCPFRGAPGDPGRFPVCGTKDLPAKGRCLDPALVPDPRIASRLLPCPTGLCVPEVYVTEKGQHLPTACASFAGIEGRCFSRLFKDVAAQESFLPKDVCAEEERCVPCFNPATGQPTGACSTVSCDQTTKPARKLADCCRVAGKSRGKCVPQKDVPASFRGRLDDHECKGGAELCVPTDNLDPNTVPVTCAATGGVGVCMSDCVELGLIASILLDRGSCRSDQTCVPCKDPTTQKPTGAPGCPP